METLSSAIETRVFDVVKRGGYDTGQVDRFLERAAAMALELEEQVTAAHAKVNGLERQIAGTKNAEHAVGVAYIAASEAKDRMIEDAEKRARTILQRAEAEAADLTTPRRELEAQRKEVDELLQRAEYARTRADAEAEQLLAAARKQAERIVAEARRDALAAIEESKLEADDWVQQARAEHQRVALMLRGLKAAVRDMLDEAAERNEAIGVVLTEEAPDKPASVKLPS